MRTDMPDAQLDALRKEVIQLIESSRRTEEGYMVPRTATGDLADPNNTGIVALLTAHRAMWSTMREEASTLWAKRAADRRAVASQAAQQFREKEALTQSSSSAGGGAAGAAGAKALTTTSSARFETGSLLPEDKSAQIMLDIKACIFSVGEATELQFHLYSATERRALTEVFHLELTAAGA